MKVHFDADGSPEEYQAIMALIGSFLALIGFPVSTSMTKSEQDAVAVDESKTADVIHDVTQTLKTLGKQ